jgi:hypothetical protein
VHKKDVLIVGQILFNIMAERDYANSGLNACSVSERLSGKRNTTVPHGDDTGSNCGLQRVALLNYFASYQGTAKLNSIALKIIGLKKLQRSITITPMSST